MVLLKNEDNILPGRKNQKIAVMGQYAKQPIFEGMGSSKVNPIVIDNAYDAFIEYGYKIEYEQGYKMPKDLETKEELLEKAKEMCKDKDLVYLFVG